VRASALGLAVVTAAVLLGAFLRLYALDAKPMHGDEANQAHKAGRLLEGEGYRFDPHEHHGPTLYYLTLPAAWLLGQDTYAETTEWTYRLIPALAGIAAIALVWSLRPYLSASGTSAAALLLAISPAFAYYSRYYIQEMLFVLFVLLLLAGLGRYLLAPRWWWAVLAGLAAGLLHATKETCVIVFAAGAMALLPLMLRRWRSEPGTFARDVRAHAALKCLGVVTAILVSVAWYSNGFTYWQGPIDSIATFEHYLPRSGGEGSSGVHEWPWSYYLSLLAYTRRTPGAFWSEGLIFILALAGMARTVFGVQRSAVIRGGVQFLGLFTLLLTAIYSAIPYKTPWNLLPFWLGWILLAGYGAGWVVQAPRGRAMRAGLACVVALAAAHLAAQAWRTVFEFPAAPRNPYVYAHTSTALEKFVDQLHGLAAVHPDGYGMNIEVISPEGDYWPLPWYLRQFGRVAYRQEWNPAGHPAVIIAAGTEASSIYPGIREQYTTETFSVRPAVLRVAMIDRMLWQRYMADRR